MKKIIYTILVSLFVITAVLSCVSAPAGTSAKGELPQYSGPGWKSVRIVGGGFVPGIIFNTKQKDLIYARTDMGGAYCYDPETDSWIPLTDFAGVEDYGRLGIASIATDPVEPNRLVIASGTYTNDWDKTTSQMLVSEDYGATFSRVDMPFKMGGNMPGRGCGERLAIDPNDNRIVYFGSFGDGLWKSADYGHTWAKAGSFPTSGNVYDADFAKWQGGFKHFYGIVWVVFDPASGKQGNGSKNIYAGVIDTGFTIYESTDAGATWHPLEGQPNKIAPDFKPASDGLYGLLPEKDMAGKYYPLKSTYSPEGAMIVSYNAGLGPFSSSYQGGAVWKYAFAKKEWTDISLPKHDPDPSRTNNDRGVGSVAVDWSNPKVMIASTLNEWWPDEYIYRTTDGGKNWTPIWYLDGWPDRVNKYSLDISLSPWLNWGTEKQLPEQNPKLGWMMTDIEIDPFNPNKMMYGTGATIYGSTNLTDWDKNKKVNIRVMALGIEETAVLDLVSPPEGAHLVSGMGDIGGFVHTDLNKAPNMIVNPNIGAVNSIDYAENLPSFIIRMGGGLIGISEDGGATWSPTEKVLENVDKGWSGKVAVSTDAKTIVWSPAGEVSPHWTTDKGKTWNKCAGLPNASKVISDRVNPNKFYGFGNGTFYASADAGKTFVVTNETQFKADKEVLTASDFTAVIGMEGEIWFACGKLGLFNSGDGGKTWTKIPGMDETPVIGLGKAAPGAEYQALYTNAKLSGKWGIYRSDDKGATWVRINDDMHQFGAATQAITGDPRIYGRVYLGSNGRGILYRDLE